MSEKKTIKEIFEQGIKNTQSLALNCDGILPLKLILQQRAIDNALCEGKITAEEHQDFDKKLKEAAFNAVIGCRLLSEEE